MGWLGWMLSPVGRWVSGAGATIALVLAAYWKAREDGKNALRREQADENARRTRNALEADDGVRRDIIAGRLRDDDGHRRD
jgi:hypothetical protein